MARQILKEEADQILSQVFWDKAGVKLSESKVAKKAITESEELDEDEVEEIDESEEVEEHVCPLCEHVIEEEISDERLEEHINFFIDMISEMSSIEDEDLEDLDEAASEIVEELEEEEVSKKKVDEGGKSSPERTKARDLRQAGKSFDSASNTLKARNKHSKPHRVFTGLGQSKIGSHLPKGVKTERAVKKLQKADKKFDK